MCQREHICLFFFSFFLLFFYKRHVLLWSSWELQINSSIKAGWVEVSLSIHLINPGRAKKSFGVKQLVNPVSGLENLGNNCYMNSPLHSKVKHFLTKNGFVRFNFWKSQSHSIFFRGAVSHSFGSWSDSLSTYKSRRMTSSKNMIIRKLKLEKCENLTFLSFKKK